VRNKIFGGIGMLWGGSMVFRWFTAPAAGSAAYQAGGTGAMLLGVLMFVAGAYAFFRKPAE
jgi:hypothetical protein